MYRFRCADQTLDGFGRFSFSLCSRLDFDCGRVLTVFRRVGAWLELAQNLLDFQIAVYDLLRRNRRYSLKRGRRAPFRYPNYPGCRQPLLVNTRFQSRPGLLNGHCSPTNAHLAVCGPSGSGERSTPRRLWGVIAISVSNIQVVHSRWSGFLRSKEDWYVRSGGRRYLLSMIRSR